MGLKLLAISPATLRKELSSEDGVTAQPAEMEKYIGMEGVAVTDLRPAGAAFINGKRVDVVSRGEYLNGFAKGGRLVGDTCTAFSIEKKKG